MTRQVLIAGTALSFLLASAPVAFADDPTTVLLAMRGMTPPWPGPVVPAFLARGPCYQHMHYESFPIGGYRCIRDYDYRD
jgi:hypothetical protein